MKVNTLQTSNQYKINSSPAFSGYTRTKFGHRIDEFISSSVHTEENANNLIGLLKKSFAKIHHKKLGEGFRGAVYKIDDKYVLKVNRQFRDEQEYVPMLINNDLFKNLKSYYGASLLAFNGYIKVLKNVSSSGKHIPVGIPDFNSSNMLIAEKNNFWSTKYLPIFSSLPQKSFDRIAKDFAELNKVKANGYYFEFDTKNPNNFVLVGNSLRIVDDVDKTYKQAPNCTGGLLRVFLEKMDLDNVAPMDIMNQAQRHKLLKKIILAGEKYELPHVRGEIDFRTWQYVFDESCDYRYLLEQLRKYRELYPDMKIRLEKVKQLLDTEISSGYNDFYGGMY